MEYMYLYTHLHQFSSIDFYLKPSLSFITVKLPSMNMCERWSLPQASIRQHEKINHWERKEILK